MRILNYHSMETEMTRRRLETKTAMHKKKIICCLSPRNVVSFRLRAHLPLAQSSRLTERETRTEAAKYYASTSYWCSLFSISPSLMLCFVSFCFFYLFFQSVNHWRRRRRRRRCDKHKNCCFWCLNRAHICTCRIILLLFIHSSIARWDSQNS